MNRSTLKTKLIRAGFVHVGYGSTKRTDPYINSWKLNGRLYRFRRGEYGSFSQWVTYPKGVFVMDVSCPLKDFDRWANSCDHTIESKDLSKYGYPL